MLLPALAYSDGSILAAGGRPTSSEYSASVISESSSEDFGSSSDNIFFMQSIAANGNLYTFGGYEVDKDENALITSKTKYDSDGNATAETRLNRNRKWNISGKSVSAAKDLLRSYDANVIFPSTIQDQKNNRFIVIGGTNAANIYQVINADSLVPYQEPTSHLMTDKRIMSSAVIVPSGIIGDTPIIVITGGSSSLDEKGSVSPAIKINNL